MGRFELKYRINELSDVTRLCDKAIAGNSDAVVVPPVFASSAAAMLKQNRIQVICPVAQADDLPETKVWALEATSKKFADGVIISIAPQNIFDECWEIIEKELFQLSQSAQMENVILWIGCKFSGLSRVEQAKICNIIPRGAGLRMRNPVPDDVKFVGLCSSNEIPVCVSYVGSINNDLDEFIEAGATCFSVWEMPPQKKTDQLFINGEKV